jgi:hypothetical protein
MRRHYRAPSTRLADATRLILDFGDLFSPFVILEVQSDRLCCCAADHLARYRAQRPFADGRAIRVQAPSVGRAPLESTFEEFMAGRIPAIEASGVVREIWDELRFMIIANTVARSPATHRLLSDMAAMPYVESFTVTDSSRA